MGKHDQGKRRVRIAVTFFLALLVLGVLSRTAQRFGHGTADHDIGRARRSSHGRNSNFDPRSVQRPNPLISASVLTGNLPSSFEPNRGQTNSHVKFISRGSGYNVFLTSTEAVFALHALQTSAGLQNDAAVKAAKKRRERVSVLRITLKGANPQ